MQIIKLRQIVDFNKRNQAEIEELVHEICISNNINVRIMGIQSILRELCKKLDIKLIEIPIRDLELGAVFYACEQKKYILLNSNVPRANVNFALAHELFHIIFKSSAPRLKMGDIFVIDEYVESDMEMFANAFAGALLMPQNQISCAYDFFARDYDDFETIIKLMGYFSTTYMSVLIRLLEIGKLKDDNIPTLTNKSKAEIAEAVRACDIREDLLTPTKRDDSDAIVNELRNEGKHLLDQNLISERQLRRTIGKVEKILERLNGT